MRQDYAKLNFVLLLLALVVGCTKKNESEPSGSGEPLGVVVVANGGGGGLVKTRQKVPISFQSSSSGGLSLYESATAFSLTMTGCTSGYGATVTEANLDGIEVYAYDRNCLAQLNSFTLNGTVYVPTEADPFTTWLKGDVARFDEVGEPGIAPLYVIVTSTFSTSILATDHIAFGLADVSKSSDRGVLWSTVGPSGKYKTGVNDTPTFTIRSIELVGFEVGTGAGQFRFVLECTSDIGIANACAGVNFEDIDYKLVRDNYGDLPSKAQLDTVFATAGTGIALPDDRVAQGALGTTNGGFVTVTLTGPGALQSNNHVVLALRSYGVSYQYLNVDTTLAIEYDDTIGPTVLNVTTAHPDGAFPAGTEIDIDVTFDEPVTLTGTAATLSLNSGGTAVFHSKPAAATLRYRYAVLAAHAAADLDVTAFDLNGDLVKDQFGNSGSSTLPGGASSLAGSADIEIDTVAPTIASVSTSHADGHFMAGEVIDVDVTFSSAVTLTGTDSILSMNDGGTALYLSRPSSSVIRYRYNVLAGTNTPDLDVSDMLLNGDVIRDAALADANLTLPSGLLSLAGSAAIVIDTVGPTITNITSSTANGTYVTGQVISIQVTYSEAVTLTGTAPGATLRLETGTTDRNAVYVSGSGTTTLDFNYTIVASDASADLTTHATAPQLALTGTSPALRDIAGNAASMTVTGTSLGTNKAIVVDALAPTIASITSSTANGSYNAGAVISIQVTYTEPVILAGTTPGITLRLETGTTDRNAVYASGSGTATLNFNYTVVAADVAADLNTHATAPQLALTGTAPTLRDAAGNTASLTVAGTTLAASKDIVIDTAVPTVTNITSSTPNGTYKAGSVISIQVTYSEPVILAGTTPGITLRLETGTTDRLAVYQSGSGTAILSFNYTIVAGDTSADLGTHTTSPQFVLTGTTPTLRDAATNNASLTVAGTTLASNKSIVIDTTIPPALTAFTGVACCSVNPLKANGVQLTITYPATVTDYSNLKIRRVNGATAPADCTSGSLITTISGPFTGSTTTRYTDDTGVAGGAFSYRACVTDAVGNVRSTNTAVNVASAKFSWIFATSTDTYTGNLGGVAAADAACTAAGSALDGSLNWVALLSTTGLSAAGHVPIRGTVYNRAATPAAVATNFATMWGGAWATAVTYDETGAPVTGNAWTGSLSTGMVDRGNASTAINNHCANWTSAAGGNLGRYGSVTGTTTNWSELGTQACSTAGRIYCVSKTIEPLVAFSAATGTGTNGNINVTVTFPATTTGYSKVEIRRKLGATPPTTACTTDTLVKTYTGTYTSETFVDPTATNAGANFSYTACLFDATGRVAVTSTLPVRAYSSTPSHLLFATTATFTGNLGGLAGGDAICQTIGNLFDSTKTWQFVASDSTTDVATRLVIGGNVRNMNGVLLATSEADFFDGTLTAAISLTQNGVASTNRSWTGSANNGTKKGAGLYCADWTDGTAGANGRRGRHSTTTTYLDEGTVACNTALPLYCISAVAY